MTTTDIKTLSNEFDKDLMIDAQKKTIEKLTKKLRDLEAENEEIKKLKTQEAKTPETSVIMDEDGVPVSDEETICKKQLKILRDKSLFDELTFEETKKAEIYTKTLQLIKSSTKKDKKVTMPAAGNLLEMLRDMENEGLAK